MLCTEVLNGMVQTFKTMEFSVGKEFDVVTVSIDPTESPDLAADKKEEYVAEYGRASAQDGWHFLTGEQASITGLAKAVGFRYVYDEKSKQYAHAAGIMVATPQGVLARYHYGIEFGARDLKFALMEASEGRIGSPVDKLLLLCYHYDPTTGKYGVLVMTMLKIGGGLCILLLGAYMFVNFRRDRRSALQTARM
jgi:protein SCO1/2